jgi:hypothetical protein
MLRLVSVHSAHKHIASLCICPEHVSPDGCVACSLIWITGNSANSFIDGSKSFCWGPGDFFSSVILYTVGGWGPLDGDQSVTRLLLTQRTARHRINAYASSGVRSHDPSVRAGEDSSCPIPHRYRGQLKKLRGLNPRANYTDRAITACRRR